MKTTIEEISSRIFDAAQAAGRKREEITLIAVSKTYPVEKIHEAIAAGLSIFGESRVQEAATKISALPQSLQWHFIGHLQRNKIRAALPLFSCLHSVDSLPLATAISRISAEFGKRQRILLEVNISGESTKHGFAPVGLGEILPQLLELPNLDIQGLMTMAPYSENPENARPVFAALRKLRDQLADSSGVPLQELSMGMSGDFVPAIEEGATMVRIGSALFGARH